MSALFRLLRSRLNPPKPSHASFIGQTILITAASGGLGLEAAKHLAAQGTSTLIITARDEKKGAAAKAAIEAHLKTFSPNPNKSINILTLVLEMSDPSSIHAFIDALKSHTTHLDQAILNAGLVQAKHTMSSGYETTIRVNTISTTLLGLLLLPLLLASRLTTQQSISSRPHLSFISSGTAWLFTGPEKWRPYSNDANPVAALSKAEAFPPGRMGGQAEYATSKLLLEMSIRKIAFLPSLLSDPSDPKSEPKVLVTSTCKHNSRPNPQVRTNTANASQAQECAAPISAANTPAKTPSSGSSWPFSSSPSPAAPPMAQTPISLPSNRGSKREARCGRTIGSGILKGLRRIFGVRRRGKCRNGCGGR